ncbi:MAG: formylglycine-generating enzyme family protein [Candidatus Competibacteraceae bacterium]|nr:formylglycine-generating enzyme family protein [Candidatus Competibacteraceae bacterium]
MGPKRETIRHILRQRGESLFVEGEGTATTPSDLEVPGSLVGELYAATPLVRVRWWEEDRTEARAQSLSRPVELPRQGRLEIATDRQELTLEAVVKPHWAEDIGRDQYGLYVGFRVGEVYQRMRWMVPGEFWMGSPQDEPERSDDETRHRVVLTQGYWLADTACTQALWQAVTGENPSDFKGAERPVEQVSWEDVQGFIDKLNGRLPGDGFRLPTEAEWEYACRAGTNTPFWFGNRITTEQANFDGNHPYVDGPKGQYRRETVEVKGLPCNGWGLYQMHGNVWEWCSDWYGAYDTAVVDDPTGPVEGENRVLRGGGWVFGGWSVRSADRLASHPALRDHDIGFRLARGRAAGG